MDNQTAKELALSIKDNIQQQMAMLNDKLETQKKIAEEQKDLRIKQITEALKNAEAANITSPLLQQTQDVTQETMFLIGSEALQSMIDNEASRPLVFPDTYYQIKKILDIEKLNVTPDTIHTYSYFMQPALPLQPDGPKKTIMLILAVLLGGVIGSGFVLGYNELGG